MLLLRRLMLLFVLCASVVHAQSFSNPRRLPTVSDPVSAQAADFNGDGRPDFYFLTPPQNTNANLPNQLILLLAQPNGSYRTVPSISVPGDTLCRAYDLNGDGLADLVCVGLATYVGPNRVPAYSWLGNGDGTFQPRQTTSFYEASPPINAPYNALQNTLLPAADLDGDGNPDAVFLDATGRAVVALLGDGKGGFRTSVITPYAVPYGINVTATVADLNGDGVPDLVFSDGTHVYLGTGTGAFQPQSGYFYQFPVCVYGDMERTGHLDAVCNDTKAPAGEDRGLAVLHGNPDGSFNGTPLAETSTPAEQVIPIALRDLNGDDLPDLIGETQAGMVVLLGQPGLTFAPPVLYALNNLAGFDSLHPEPSAIQDFNGDGHPDVAVAGPNGIYLTYGRADGTFDILNAPLVTQTAGPLGYAAVADFNLDGTPDVVTSANSLQLFLGTGQGTFQPPTTLYNPSFTGYNGDTQVFAGDFNGDGKPDFIAQGQGGVYPNQFATYLGNGDGTFAPPVASTINDFLADVATIISVADVNGDGRTDVLFQSNDYKLEAWLAHKDGTFNEVDTLLPSTANQSFGSRPAVADFDEDGKADVVLAGSTAVLLLHGNGDGTFTPGTLFPLPAGIGQTQYGIADALAGDFDHDGHQDFALLAYGTTAGLATSTSLVVFYGKGDGTFAPPQVVATLDHVLTRITAGDLNGDGLLDLVLNTSSPSDNVHPFDGPDLAIFTGQPGRTFAPELDLIAGIDYNSLALADFNRDGRPDILVSNGNDSPFTSANSFVLLLNGGSVPYATVTATPEPSYLGRPFTLTATLTPPAGITTDLGGSFTFLFDGTALGSVPVTGNTASFAVITPYPAGTHTLAAQWSGNAAFAAQTANGTHVIQVPTAAGTLAASPGPSLPGQPFTLTATLTPPPGFSALPAGTVVFLLDGAPVGSAPLIPGTGSSTASVAVGTVLASGSHSLSAQWSGDVSYPALTLTATHLVSAAATSLTLAANTSSPILFQPVSFLATLTSPVAAAPSPTGTVSFAIDGQIFATLPAAPSFQLSQPFTTPGLHTVTATYPGDTFHLPATASLSETVQPAIATLSLTGTPNPSSVGQPVTFTATLAAPSAIALTGLTVTLTGLPGAPVTLPLTSAATATYTTATLPAGQYTIVASFSGNASLASVTSAPVLQTVNPAVPSIQLTAQPNPAYQTQPVLLTAALVSAVHPTGSLQFFDGQTLLATVPLSTPTLSLATLAPGQHPLTARFTGDSQNLAATSPILTETILPADFAVTTTPAALSVVTGYHTTFALSATATGNYAGQLQFSTSPLPSLLTLRFTPAAGQLSAGNTLSSSIYLDTDAVIGYKSGLLPGASFRLGAALLTLLTLMLLPRNHRRRLPALLLLLLTAALLTQTLGCSGLYPSSVAPGVYPIQITATDTRTGLSHTTTLTLTVTPDR